jgi:hypothetical protein
VRPGLSRLAARFRDDSQPARDWAQWYACCYGITIVLGITSAQAMGDLLPLLGAIRRRFPVGQQVTSAA